MGNQEEIFGGEQGMPFASWVLVLSLGESLQVDIKLKLAGYQARQEVQAGKYEKRCNWLAFLVEMISCFIGGDGSKFEVLVKNKEKERDENNNKWVLLVYKKK